MAVREIAKQRGVATAEDIAAMANDAGDLNSDAADDAANMAAAYATHTAADARDRDHDRAEQLLAAATAASGSTNSTDSTGSTDKMALGSHPSSPTSTWRGPASSPPLSRVATPTGSLCEEQHQRGGVGAVAAAAGVGVGAAGELRVTSECQRCNCCGDDYNPIGSTALQANDLSFQRMRERCGANGAHMGNW